jgi:hypothetical protein
MGESSGERAFRVLIQGEKERNMPEATYDPRDLSNGHYPHLRKVAIDDPEFLDIQRWFTSKGAPAYSRLYVPKGLGVEGDNLILPTEMHWNNQNGETLKLDAALVFNFPHVALVELKHAFHFGNPNILEMYPGLRKPVRYVAQSPIGAPWPERGPNAFRPSEFDKEPYGATYFDATGSYRKDRYGWAFISYPVWIKL